MDKLTLSRIDEELETSEVSALCFLCRDVVNRKRLEGIVHATELFQRLDEKCLLQNQFFLSELLRTIHRADLLSLLETDSREQEETDARPALSCYRVMLYEIYGNMTQQDFRKMKFLLSSKLCKKPIDECKTVLDVFAEMEKTGLLSQTNLEELYEVLKELDQHLVKTVQNYMQRITQKPQATVPPRVSMDYQVVHTFSQVKPASLSTCEGRSSFRSEEEQTVKPSSPFDQSEYYDLLHDPRGICAVFSNETFLGNDLKNRAGTRQDEKSLDQVFSELGFSVVVHSNLTAEDMRRELRELGRKDFRTYDALVVCVLSHGEEGCVFGTDEKRVSLRELTQPFTSVRAPTLAGKPKLFFIQACQGSSFQRGSLRPPREEGGGGVHLEEDAGPVYSDTVPTDADFLVGMATVPECRSFRNTSTGSIYIQELCKQLLLAAKREEKDDVLSVLTRVNREVSRGQYLNHKQMPEPKYTLTKKLVLSSVRR